MTQEYIDGHCPGCSSDRVFVTTVSPTGYAVCCECNYRTSNLQKPIGDGSRRTSVGYAF